MRPLAKTIVEFGGAAQTSRRNFLRLAACAVPAIPLLAQAPGVDGAYFVYIGTYTGPESKGIYVLRFHPSTGSLTEPVLAAETPNPTFLTVHPNGKFVFAVDEGDRGSVRSYAIESGDGRLRALDQVPTQGGGPCYVSLDRAGHTLFAANYNTGSIAAFPVKEDGRLGDASAFVQHRGSGADPARQAGPHAHWIEPSPDNRFVLACDLGLDQILVYRFDANKGTLTPNAPPFLKMTSGSGPRHAAFTPDGRFVYLASEMASTVTAMAYDAKAGALRQLQIVSMLPAGFHGENTAAEIAVDAAGRFVYASNRGHDSIAVFSIDHATGKLTPVDRTPTQGREPRNFRIDPTGRYLFAANQNSGDVVVFHVDAKSGRLTPAGKKFAVDKAVCVAFTPAI